MSAARRIAAIGLTLSCAGCLDKFSTPSAYDEVHYFCDDPMALATRVSDCRDRNGRGERCGGVIGFKGLLEGNSVTVDSSFDASVFRIVPDRNVTLLGDVSASGPSPYFRLRLDLLSVGGRADVIDENGRYLIVNSRAQHLPADLQDEVVNATLRLTSGGDSVGLEAVTGSGAVIIHRQSPDRIDGTFDASFGAGSDRITGCFQIIALEKRQVIPNP